MILGKRLRPLSLCPQISEEIEGQPPQATGLYFVQGKGPAFTSLALAQAELDRRRQSLPETLLKGQAGTGPGEVSLELMLELPAPRPPAT